MIEMEAFAADCRVRGLIELGDRRMSDTLNAMPELVLHDARLEALDDGHVVEVPELAIDRGELYAVVAAGTRGDPARRVHTHTTRVVVDLGPYHVEGAVHGTTATDPLKASLRRMTWVALTEATVRYRDGTQAVDRDVATLLVNRDTATVFRAVEEQVIVLPWETPREEPTPTSQSMDPADTAAP